MSIETSAGLYVVKAEASDTAEMARIITEAAIWRQVEMGLNKWSTAIEPNLELASEAIDRGIGYVGYAADQAIAAMLLGGPDASDATHWGDTAGDHALYVHKLSVGTAGHKRRFGEGMLDAASDIAEKAGKTALRLHYIAAPEYEGLRQYYRRQGFFQRGTRRDGCRTTIALLERPVDPDGAE